ncbi:MAG: hypothetical protein LBJ00_03910 [Planctomycetaceae bacterium]|nr:hypothetical protein [Planctomycetaceae bacterium]
MFMGEAYRPYRLRYDSYGINFLQAVTKNFYAKLGLDDFTNCRNNF